MKEWIALVPLFPFLGVLANGVILRKRIGKTAVHWIACGSVFLSFAFALGASLSYMLDPSYAGGEPFEVVVYSWLPAGSLQPLLGSGLASLQIPMGFLLDPLAVAMTFVVTFVGFWIHVYSIGYMGDDPGYQRFFTYMNLFMGAMLLLVLGNNYLTLFVGWEGVGLCSYLLIGYYFDQDFPPYAGRKAFIVNRIGDAGFLLALFALASSFGSLEFTQIFPTVLENPQAATGELFLGLTTAEFVALFLFIGAVGKSAQIPLYVWLPDAMAGPTPVSALIHAATMVTAGVYMVVRSNALYQLAPGVSLLVAVVGALTALYAATIGLAQTDIKKVLAYSTVSQLGYMFLAAGVGAYTAAIFHLYTHAFFKALLFLGAGSVIHAMRGEQDMRRMGGLRSRLPWTYATFLVATLAIAGMPPLAGFFSKDQILASAFGDHKLLWTLGLVTAGLTACYMFRALYLTFFDRFRGTEEERHHLHESPPVMTVPLVVLAVGAVVAGWVGVPRLGELDLNWFDRFLGSIVHRVEPPAGEHAAHHLSVASELGLMALSVAVAAVGILVAWRVYGRGRGLVGGEAWADRFPGVHRVLTAKYYVDELYDATLVRGTWASARGLFRFDAGFIDDGLVNGSRHLTVGVSLLSGFFDKYVVDGLVNLLGRIMNVLSRLFRRVQTGLVSQYALVFAFGVFFLVCFYLVLRMQ